MNEPCKCWDEDVRGRAFSLTESEPMPPRSDFTDNCQFIRHYCDHHWRLRNGSVAYRTALDAKLDMLRSKPKGDQ